MNKGPFTVTIITTSPHFAAGVDVTKVESQSKGLFRNDHRLNFITAFFHLQGYQSVPSAPYSNRCRARAEQRYGSALISAVAKFLLLYFSPPCPFF